MLAYFDFLRQLGCQHGNDSTSASGCDLGGHSGVEQT